MSQRTVLLVHNNTQINNLIIFSNFFHFASTFPWNFLRIFVLHVHKMCKCRNCGNVAQFSRWYIKIHSGEGKSIWHSIMADGSRAFYSNKIKKIQWVYFFEFVEFIRLYSTLCIYFVYIFVFCQCFVCVLYYLHSALIYIVYYPKNSDHRFYGFMSYNAIIQKYFCQQNIFDIDSRFDRNNCFSRYWYLSFIFIV